MSPCRACLVRPWLYRNRLGSVILAVLAVFTGVCVGPRSLHAQGLVQQYGRKPVSKGPRALGLVQISKTGKARIIPIAIMMDGKFFDAGSYKATPVPMALDFGVVYEAFHTGVSQGLFTITQPGRLGQNWIAEGTWLPEGAKPKETTKKYAPPVIEEDNRDERPVLHRRAEGAADKDESKKDDSKPTAGSPTTSSTNPPSATPSTGTPASTPSTTVPSTTNTPESTSASTQAPKAESQKPKAESREPAPKTSDLDQPFNDPNRPILRRGKPDPNAHHGPFVSFDDTAEESKTAKDSSVKDAVSIQTITAISDAGGPDPRPYTYDVKPAEEAIYRTRMLDLAATLVQPSTPGAANTTSAAGAAKTASPVRKKPSASKNKPAPAKPKFDDVNLRIFDLSNSNEPVLVLSARTPLPPAGASASTQEPQEITLIARTNLEGELQKLFFAQTDSRHLDVSPRMELIDAVDADGDGRGELLFRQTSDAGSVYAIYRVTADGLWKLYEGTP